MKQVLSQRLEIYWGYEIFLDRTDRKFDFSIFKMNQKKKYHIIENQLL